MFLFRWLRLGWLGGSGMRHLRWRLRGSRQSGFHVFFTLLVANLKVVFLLEAAWFRRRVGYAKMLAQQDRDVFVDRAGMGLLFRNAQLGQEVQDPAGLDLQLPREFVDSDLFHS